MVIGEWVEPNPETWGVDLQGWRQNLNYGVQSTGGTGAALNPVLAGATTQWWWWLSRSEYRTSKIDCQQSGPFQTSIRHLIDHFPLSLGSPSAPFTPYLEPSCPSTSREDSPIFHSFFSTS